MSLLSRKRTSHPTLSGLRFGMLLQLAVGPVCLFVFRIGTEKGIFEALLGVIAVTFIDALYVLLAGLGISALLHGKRTQELLHILGALVVCVFGADILFGAVAHNFLPSINLFGGGHSGSSFTDALFLTASNPLTILFWSGVFSSKIAEGSMSRRETCFFGLGCILATLLFLTIVAFLGNIAGSFLPSVVIRWMNGFVGAALLLFGFKQLFARRR